MKRFHVRIAGFLLVLLAAFAPQGRAADYIGDTLIYSATAAGVTPNVLIIIDNSRATLNAASGEKYVPGTVYPDHGYQPWTIYEGNNQGTFTKIAVAQANANDSALSNLTCNANNDIVRTTLLASGTYSGSGTALSPNLKFGGCDTGPKGAYYALGNYLNYLKSPPPPAGGAECPTPPQVKACKNVSQNKSCGYFELRNTHTAAENPAANNSDDAPNWNQYSAAPDGLPAAGDPPMWVQGTTYTMPVCENAEIPSDSSDAKSQRQIVYEALETVINGARWAVNFGAMTYGGNNSGGKVVHHMADLSNDTVFNAFLTAIPGPGASDGEPVLSSNTGRPQAESLYDAGYYFGATYPNITNTARIPSDIVNDCGFNHIILITNGLSNGDGSPRLGTYIGNADGDDYPDESTYGLGSHYLDDTARYLKDTYGITTHTVLAFQNEDPLVKKAAAEGGGQFYNVFNEEELAEALTKLLASIVLETDTAFVAPVVPTNPENRTFSGQRVYLGFFYPKTQQEWYGNLKKFGINSNNQIVDKNGDKAICPDSRDNHCASNSVGDGNFRLDAVSYWGTQADGGKVEVGGAGAVLLGMSSRNIYTYPPGSATKELWQSANSFSTANAAITSALLGLDNDTEKSKLINFVHGKNAYAPAADINGNGILDNEEKRKWIMGDILHSKPLVVSYNSFNYANENSWDHNKSVIYVGGNDGMLHAIKDSNGEELWSFIPPSLLGKLKVLPGTDHNIFVDASPTAYRYDKDGDGNIEPADGDKVILIFGLRRGGSAYYALDVTVPTEPKFLWEITPATNGFGELGQSWSEPQFGKVRAGTTKKLVAFVGAGYDNENEDRRFGNTQTFPANHNDPPVPGDGNSTSGGTATSGTNPKGRGVFAFEIATLDNVTEAPTIPTSPVLVWKFTATGSTSTHNDVGTNQGLLKYSFPGDVAPVDTNFDGYIDRLYIGDTGGRLWRISDYQSTGDLRPLNNPNILTWFGKVIFSANHEPNHADYASASKGRKIFYRPSVVFENGYLGIYFGTGDREHPLNTAVVDRLYAVYDRGQRTNENISESNLEDVTADLLQAATAVTAGTCDPNSTAINCILQRLSSTSNYGWYIRMDTNYGALPGEKILAPALIFNKVAYFTSYSPNLNPSAGCVGNLGTSRLWAVNYKTGEAVFNFNPNNDGSESVTNERSKNSEGIVKNWSDRFSQLGVGIPSGLVIAINASGDAQVLIGCGGGICGGESMPGGTIFPVYWMPW